MQVSDVILNIHLQHYTVSQYLILILHISITTASHSGE